MGKYYIDNRTGQRVEIKRNHKIRNFVVFPLLGLLGLFVIIGVASPSHPQSRPVVAGQVSETPTPTPTPNPPTQSAVPPPTSTVEATPPVETVQATPGQTGSSGPGLHWHPCIGHGIFRVCGD